jgi:hypothetical protein
VSNPLNPCAIKQQTMFIYNIPKLERIIDNYKKQKNRPVDYHVQFCLDQENLKDAIEAAARAVDDYGKIHFHQRRVAKADLMALAEKLMSLENEFANAKNFDKIYEIIKKTNQSGINEITVFDTAFRIGSYLNLFPDKIYLTSGTRIGAEHLLGKLDNRNTLLPTDFPSPFQRKDLSIADIEDILYVCRNEFEYCVK